MIPSVLDALRPSIRKVLGVPKAPVWSDSDLIVFVGQNGSGKSLVRRLIKAFAREEGLFVYDFSQERRSIGGIESAMLFGNENYQSTGYISLQTFMSAFKQTQEKDHVLLWDEPEIGLSEESVLGLAQYAKQQLKRPRKNMLGCIFMTHSRLFLQEVLDHPHLVFIDLDRKYKTPQEWLGREVRAAAPDEVVRRGHERFLEIRKLMNIS